MSRTPSRKNSGKKPAPRLEDDRYDEYDYEKQRYAPTFQHRFERGNDYGKRHFGSNYDSPGGNPGRENEPRREEPGPDNSPTPTEPPEYRDEPPPEEKADRPGWPTEAPRYSAEENNDALNEEEIDRGDYLHAREDLGRNHQKARRLSQDDVEEWQNKGTPARGRSSRAFEDEIRYHEYRDDPHDHPHWHDEGRGRHR